MNSKERVLRSLRHQETDRVPFRSFTEPLINPVFIEQHILPHGTRDEVKNEVGRMIKIMSPGGGYFFGPTHNFQDDIPTENILAMYEAGK